MFEDIVVSQFYSDADARYDSEISFQRSKFERNKSKFFYIFDDKIAILVEKKNII